MIEKIELVEGNTYRITSIEELDKEKLFADRTAKVNEISAHKQVIDSLTQVIANIDSKLSIMTQ
jgi:hypothetical protein